MFPAATELQCTMIVPLGTWALLLIQENLAVATIW